MRRNVVHNQFRTYKDHGTIWDEQICGAVRLIELAEFAMVNAAENHWLPWVDQQFLEFHEAAWVSWAGWKGLINSEPANRTKDVCVFVAKVIALGQIMEVRHGSFFKG